MTAWNNFFYRKQAASDEQTLLYWIDEIAESKDQQTKYQEFIIGDVFYSSVGKKLNQGLRLYLWRSIEGLTSGVLCQSANPVYKTNESWSTLFKNGIITEYHKEEPKQKDILGYQLCVLINE